MSGTEANLGFGHRSHARARAWWRRLPVAAAVVLLGAIGLGGPPARSAGMAAAPAPVPSEITAEQAPALVARLSDAQVRALLLDYLSRNAPPPAAATSNLDAVASASDRLRGRLEDVAAAAARLPELPAFIAERVTADRSSAPVPVKLAKLALIVLAGVAAELLYRRVVRRLRARIGAISTESAGIKTGFLALWLVLDLIGVAVFAVAAFATFLVVNQNHLPARLLATSIILAIVIVRVADHLATLLLSPRAAGLRLGAASNETARYAHRWVRAVALAIAIGWAVQSFVAGLGAPEDTVLLIRLGFGALIALLLIVIIWQCRSVVGHAIGASSSRGGHAGAVLRTTVGEIWHLLATAYVLFAWAAWAADLLLGDMLRARSVLASLVMVGALPLLDRWTAALLPFVAPAGADARERRLPAARLAVHLIVVALVLAVMLDSLGFAVLQSVRTPVGEVVLAAALQITVAVLIATIGWRLLRAWLDRHIRSAESAGDEETPASRLQTLLPMVRVALLTLLVAMVGMIVLSSLGINIGPLLAGAGMIGLAVGFGAQTLVRDIITGVFYLLEDAFRVGEYIEMDRIRGTVEAISLRSLRLRHHRGAVHTMPFGQIRSITNYSRDWLIDKLELAVTYDTDIDQVNRILKQIGREMMEDEELAKGMLEPLKSQGVSRLADSAIVIRAKIKSRPGLQFLVRREAYRRIKRAFDENGIKFAYPTVTIAGQAPPGTAEAVAAVNVIPFGSKEPTKAE